jgi:hypothetical protein
MALRRAIAKTKQRWSVIGWVTKNLLSFFIGLSFHTEKYLVLLFAGF